MRSCKLLLEISPSPWPRFASPTVTFPQQRRNAVRAFSSMSSQVSCRMLQDSKMLVRLQRRVRPHTSSRAGSPEARQRLCATGPSIKALQLRSVRFACLTFGGLWKKQSTLSIALSLSLSLSMSISGPSPCQDGLRVSTAAGRCPGSTLTSAIAPRPSGSCAATFSTSSALCSSARALVCRSPQL